MPWIGVAPNKTFQRTDGTRSGSTVWQSADSAGVDIVPDDHDTHDEDIGDSLNLALLKNGDNTATADIPFGGNKPTNLGNAEAVNQALTFDQAQDNKHQYIPTVGGTADVITLTSPAGLTVGAYAEGQKFDFIAGSANTGAVTVAIDGLAATTVKRFDGSTDLVADDIRSGGYIQIGYDGTNFQLDSASQSGASADILARVLPTGAEIWWGLDTIPAGWLKLTGTFASPQSVTKADYPELDLKYFTDSYPYGASSATQGVGTMNLPPAAGRFVRVPDSGTGVDGDAASRTDRGDGTTGDNVGTPQGHAVENHGHTVTNTLTQTVGGNDNKSGPAGSGVGYNSGQTTGQALGGSVAVADDSVLGGTVSTETRGTNIYQFLIILANPTAAAAASVGLFGYAYKFDATTGAASDPGAGFLRFDAVPGSAVEMYIDDVDQNGANVADAIATWDNSDSTNKAQIKITKVGAPANFLLYDITAANSPQSGYTTITVSFVDSNGTFSTNDQISVELYRSGDKGARGDSGFKYSYSNASQVPATTDPGDGNILLDSDLTSGGSFSAVTVIGIADETGETGNPSLRDFLLTWDDSTSTVKGYITLTKASAKENFGVYSITSLDSGQPGFVPFTVAHVDSAGTLADTDELSVFFSRTGDKGDTGAAGTNGVNAGLKYTYSSDTNTGEDAGTGIVRFNSAPASIENSTQISLTDESAESGNPDVSAFIATWDDSTNTVNGHLHVKNIANPEEFVIFRIDSIDTAPTGYSTVTGVVTDNAGTLVDADTLQIEFSRAGDAGSNGTNGTNGVSSGLYFKYDSSTNTAQDPSTGHWRASSGTLSAATTLAISINTQESGNPDVEDFINAWEDSTNTGGSPAAVKGHLIIKNRDNPEEFVIYELASVQDGAAGVWRQITVQNGVGSGTLTDEDDCVIEFYRVGDKGTDGAGAGDVVGPGSATNNAVPRYDTTTGKLIQNSLLVVDDSGNSTGIVNSAQTGYHDLAEISTPANPGDDVARLYSKAVSGVTKLHFKRGSTEVLIAEGSVTTTLTFLVTNDEGGALAVGDVVALDSVTPWNVTDARPNVEKADADVAAEMPAVGMVSVGGADGAEVTVTSYGTVTGLDTSGDSAGDSVYVHTTAGEYTTTRPTATATLVQKLGTVLFSDASTGRIFISGANRTNDVPNSATMNTLFLNEQAAADADVAGDGQFWVENSTPNRARFTDDAGTDWVLNKTESFIIAISDETTVLTTGTAKVTFRMPYAFHVTEVRASLTTGPTGGIIQFDVNNGGTSLLTTKLTIDNNEKTSEDAATPPVIDVAEDDWLSDDEITIDIDTVNGSPAGAKITIIGYQT